MKLNLPAVLLIFFGVLFVYSARNERDPRNVVFEALGIKRRVPEPMHVGDPLEKAVAGAAKQVPGLLSGAGYQVPTGYPAGSGPIVSV